MKAGQDQSHIANLLDRHKSTISRGVSPMTGSLGRRPKQDCEKTAVLFSRYAQLLRRGCDDGLILLNLNSIPMQITSRLPISH